MFTPADRPRFVLVFLPDLDEVSLRDNGAWTPLLAANQMACVCPGGAETWWAGRVCPSFDPLRSGEHYLMREVVPWALGQFGLMNNALAVAGVGAGGQGALRLGFKYPDACRVVAGLGSILDFHELYGRGTTLDAMYSSKEQCRQDTAILQVQAANWPVGVWFACDPDSPWLRGNDRLHEKLQALGTPHAIDFTTPGCGHSWAYYDRMAPRVIALVGGVLDRESRRLV